MDQNPNETPVSPKQQVVERVRQAANVLVTVRSNPSVDELAATIGLTLMLNKLGKHATAVFSGQIPSTLEFLKPEETLETNTDSLRDFIIALDKSKADKLRYKVEENVVKIFITPYRTSLSEKDLEFSQGDFNVDVVLALGVTQREELDQAITSHGRILHDAAVVTITAGQHESTLGTINWQEPGASSLSEMLVSISEAFQGGLIDAQMATAFLTGIVAETARFSNPKTTPKVMTMAAQLMAAGANQQLIANELEKGGSLETPVDNKETSPPQENGDNGALEIAHEDEPKAPEPNIAPPEAPKEPQEPPKPAPEPFIAPVQEESFNPLMPSNDQSAQQSEPAASESILPPPPTSGPEFGSDQIQIDSEGNLMRPAPTSRHKIIQPLPGQTEGQSTTPFSSLIAEQSDAEQNIDPLAPPTGSSSEQPATDQASTAHQPFSAPSAHAETTEVPQVTDNETLLDIEKSVHSPHVAAPETAEAVSQVDSARNAVLDAINQAGYDPARPEPRADIGAGLGPEIRPPAEEPHTYDSFRLPAVPEQPTDTPPSLPGQIDSESTLPPPPPVPPPMMPQQ